MRSAPPLGTLTDRVQLFRRDAVPDGEGGHMAVLMPIGAAWARVRPLSARRQFEADARGVAASHAVVMRFRHDLRPGDRINYRGRRLDLLSTEDLDGRRAFLSCLCSEAEATG